MRADEIVTPSLLDEMSKTVPVSVDTAAKWVHMLRRLVIRAWIDYECSTSIAKFTPVTTIFFLFNKICDGGSSKGPFLKAATLSILIWAYLPETKTKNGNFKNAGILPSKVTYRWRAFALILPLCRLRAISSQERASVLGADQKERSLWERHWSPRKVISCQNGQSSRVYITSEWVFVPEWNTVRYSDRD